MSIRSPASLHSFIPPRQQQEEQTIISNGTRPPTNKEAIITLKDVRGEFETEAEYTIFKVIEQNEQVAREEGAWMDGGNSLTSRPAFLDGIPDDKIDLFQMDALTVGGDANTTASNDIAAAVASSTDRGGGNGGNGDDDETNSNRIPSKPSMKSAAGRLMMLQRLTTKLAIANATSGIPTATANTARSSNDPTKTVQNVIDDAIISEGATGNDDSEDFIKQANKAFRILQSANNNDNKQQQQQHELYKDNPTSTNVDVENQLPNTDDTNNTIHNNDSSNNNNNNNNSSTTSPSSNLFNRPKKGLFRHYCNPCYKFTTFISLRKEGALKYAKLLFLALLLLVGTAAILYYNFDNPLDSNGVSYSWIILLIARLLVTFTLAVLTETLLIDYIFLETKLAVLSIGRFLTLMTVSVCVLLFVWCLR
jgi:hypothetical protein